MQSNLVTIITRRENEEGLISEFKKAGIGEIASGFVNGCGIEEGVIQYVEDGRNMVMLIPKVKLEISVSSGLTDWVIDTAIRLCRTGIVGDGKIFVEEIEDYGFDE